jgi:hypothetical protein
MTNMRHAAAAPRRSLSQSDAASRSSATYYTVSDRRFFVGTVLLLNSLRVSGNSGGLVVLDTGLEPGQRAQLEPHAQIVTVPRLIEGSPCMMKPYPYLVGASGTVVVIDSDIIVTAPLDGVLEHARAGKIVACPAWTEQGRTRWYAEWEDKLQLRAPLRREEWFHDGFIVLSTEHWPQLLERWWETCELVPPEQVFIDGMPFNAGDTDALNALLMSEIPRDGLHLLDRGDEGFGGDIEIEDVHTLRCSLHGRSVKLVHYLDSPKPWQPKGWLRRGATAYARIMHRLLFAPDVPLRLDPGSVEFWLRPDARGRVALGAATAANGVLGWSVRRVPDPVRTRLRDGRRRLIGGGARASVESKALGDVFSSS